MRLSIDGWGDMPYRSQVVSPIAAADPFKQASYSGASEPVNGPTLEY